ncbi:MAG: site-specific DNA-methyltransferase [Patescibacteria group bacterium]|jgi:DNA modification methylase
MINNTNLTIAKKYNTDNHYNLINNDAFLIFPQIPDGSVDHCITDPPYNISGYDFKKEVGWLKSNKYWSENKNFKKIEEDWDKFSNGDYDKFTKLWLNEIFRVVKPNGNIIIFGSYHNIYKIGNYLQESDKKIINSITWFKPNAFPNVTQRMLCESTEHVIWAVNESNKKAKNWTFNYEALKKYNTQKKCNHCKTKYNFKHNYCPYCGNKTFETEKSQLRNCWEIPSTSIGEKKHGKHPSQKPVGVIERLIIGATKKDDLIIDPFAGSGTVPLVAKNNNRKFIAIDTEKKYCDLVLKRLKDGYQNNLSI